MEILYWLAVVWILLMGTIGTRRLIQTLTRRRHSGDIESFKGINSYYLAILVLCVIVPIIAGIYCENQPRGNMPYGLFMVGLLGVSILLFVIGQFRAHRFAPASSWLVSLVFVMLTFSVGLLMALNFGSNFSL